MRYLLLLLFVSCAMFQQEPEEQVPIPSLTRDEKYLNCVVKLNREGLKQSLIKILCDSSYGSND